MKQRFMTAALLAACSAWSFCPLAAQTEVGTARLVSQSEAPITLRVNNNYEGVLVDWGDGNAVLYKEVSGTERVITGTPAYKGATITITGYSGWDMLDCSECQVSELNLMVATNLKSLYCQNNLLTELDLSGMTNLVDLDCGNNQIKELIFTDPSKTEVDLPVIENFNVSNNQLSGTFRIRTATLQYVNIAGNQYTTIYVDSNTGLNTLICDNNQIKIINVKNSTKLATLLSTGNPVTSFQLSSNTNKGAALQQLVISGNTVKGGELDLSDATQLYDLDVYDCGLTSLIMPAKVTSNTLRLGKNSLGLGVLPLSAQKPNALQFEPQATIDISGATGIIDENGVPRVDVKEWANRTQNTLDLSDYRLIGVREGATSKPDGEYEWYDVDANGTETLLKKGTSSSAPNDYYASNGKFSFFTAHKKAYATVRSKTYDVQVKLSPIVIGTDITAIHSITDGQGFNVTSESGSLIITGSESPITVYSVDGRKVWSGRTSTEGTRINLPRGIYIVNGKKVMN